MKKINIPNIEDLIELKLILEISLATVTSSMDAYDQKQEIHFSFQEDSFHYWTENSPCEEIGFIQDEKGYKKLFRSLINTLKVNKVIKSANQLL